MPNDWGNGAPFEFRPAPDDVDTQLTAFEEGLISQRRVLETRRTAEVSTLQAGAAVITAKLEAMKAALEALPDALEETEGKVEADIPRGTEKATQAFEKNIKEYRAKVSPKFKLSRLRLRKRNPRTKTCIAHFAKNC